ncbi:hypothetical protein GCM10010345_90620 [Streptomyces canarius]|uniref:Uncharacterized protein n=1 Tax=Streptomyces canarius TaxID=285453 RepID=A0ABQ3DBU8_9ACTN|nr:hypothetical protein GCM10010345_90620 [Streptomyces canarius]
MITDIRQAEAALRAAPEPGMLFEPVQVKVMTLTSRSISSAGLRGMPVGRFCRELRRVIRLVMRVMAAQVMSDSECWMSRS